MIRFDICDDELNANCSWVVGNEEKNNFWLDSWCGDPIVDTLNLPYHLQSNLTATVRDFIHNSHWNFPDFVSNTFLGLRNFFMQITLPLDYKEDKLVWKSSTASDLTFKEAFLFKYGIGQNIHWAKAIWSPDIPSSKSFLSWRLMHDKVPTDENLMFRGSYMSSMCSSCHSCFETSFHLFFKCPFAIRMRTWLAFILNKSLHFNSLGDIWSVLDSNWSSQCKVTIWACIINILNVIWFRRNHSRFQDKTISWRVAINLIISKVSLSGNLTLKTTSMSIHEFSIMKAYNVNIKHPKDPIIKEVIWCPRAPSWIMINTDGTSITNPLWAAGGGIFRNSKGACLGGFSHCLGYGNVIFVERSTVMTTIELAASNGFSNIWLESDSQLVIQAFNSKSIVP